METKEKKEHYIREHMKAAGVGVVELSRRMGVHRQTLRIAIDKSSITLQTLHRIAAALNIEAYRLLLPPDDTRQQDTHTEATEQATEHTAGRRRQGHCRGHIRGASVHTVTAFCAW